VEEFFEHMSVLSQAGPPDAAKIKELTEKYGTEIPSPGAARWQCVEPNP
jgi:hypothetical protein